jgi:hypothetical protein
MCGGNCPRVKQVGGRVGRVFIPKKIKVGCLGDEDLFFCLVSSLGMSLHFRKERA